MDDAASAEAPAPVVAVGPSEAQVNRRLLKLSSRLGNLTVKYADEEISREMCDRIRSSTQADIGSVEHSLRALQVERARPVEVLVPDLLRDWDGLMVETKRDLLSRLIHPVMVKPGRPRAIVLVRGRLEAPPSELDFPSH